MLLLLFERIAAILTRDLTVLLTAIIPGVELRGAIPVGMALGMGGIEAFSPLAINRCMDRLHDSGCFGVATQTIVSGYCIR